MENRVSTLERLASEQGKKLMELKANVDSIKESLPAMREIKELLLEFRKKKTVSEGEVNSVNDDSICQKRKGESDCAKAEASSCTRKVESPTFDGSTEWRINLKGGSFECDGDPLQFLKSENRSKGGSIIKNHTLCGGEETKNEATLARKTKIEIVKVEKEVDPSLKREKLKENRGKNVGCEDHFQESPAVEFIEIKVGGGNATKKHCFQNPNSTMKVGRTLMALKSWNSNFLGEPLSLNLVASMTDSMTMKPS